MKTRFLGIVSASWLAACGGELPPDPPQTAAPPGAIGAGEHAPGSVQTGAGGGVSKVKPKDKGGRQADFCLGGC